jgi:hypothetical protein
VTWSAKKKTYDALSFYESEYRALVEAAKEAIWLKTLFEELGFLEQGPTIIYCGNQSSIKISKNPLYHFKTKHFEIHLHFIWDMVSKKIIQVLSSQQTSNQRTFSRDLYRHIKVNI